MKARRTSRGKSPEANISKLAKSGGLKKIGQAAIEESHKMGLSVTVMENGIIYRVHPDGSKTVREKSAL